MGIPETKVAGLSHQRRPERADGLGSQTGRLLPQAIRRSGGSGAVSDRGPQRAGSFGDQVLRVQPCSPIGGRVPELVVVGGLLPLADRALLPAGQGRTGHGALRGSRLAGHSSPSVHHPTQSSVLRSRAAEAARKKRPAPSTLPSNRFAARPRPVSNP